MVERVAVLLGTVQFRLKLKVNLPESAALADAENVARSTLADGPVRKWTLVDELGDGHPVQLAVNDSSKLAYKASRPRCVGTSSRNSFGRTRISSGAVSSHRSARALRPRSVEAEPPLRLGILEDE